MISNVNIFVNRDLCYGCGICVDRCIMDNLRLSLAPCRQACPLLMNCMGYIRLIAQGKEQEAAEEMRSYTSFGGILGRICSSPCETECERRHVDGHVHVKALKRYLAEAYPGIAYRLPELNADSGKKAAVVGSGPAGMAAAYELRIRGHAVTIFEADVEPGGLLRHGIPAFRLPKSEVNRTIEMLERMGIVFKTGKALGNEIQLDDLEHTFDAVILAVGGGEPAELNIPGHDLPNV